MLPIAVCAGRFNTGSSNIGTVLSRSLYHPPGRLNCASPSESSFAHSSSWLAALNGLGGVAGTWGGAGTVAGSALKPYFYDAYWFYGLCVLVLALLALSLERLRSQRQLREVEQQLAQQLNERTKALQAQGEFFRQVIDINPSFIFVKDREGRFVLVNQAAAKTYSLQPEEIVGKTDFELNPSKEDAEAYRRDDLDVLNSGREKFIRDETHTNDAGEVRWYETTKRPIRDASGQATHLLGVATDITERKQAQESLAYESNLLRTLIDVLPDCIYVKDTASRFLIANIAVGHLMGADRTEDLVGKTDFDFFPPELAAQYYTDEQIIMQSGQALVNQEEPTVGPTNVRRWLSTTKVPLRNSEGKIIGIVGMGRDITERKQAEEELRKYKDHLEEQVEERTTELMRSEQSLRQSQKMEAIGTLSGGVAHDFNNLLTVILGYNSMILDVAQDRELRSYALQISAASERAATLTRQLLAFSRRQVLQPKVLDLNSLLLNLDKMLQRLIGEDIEMVTVPAQYLGSIKADPGQIEQVIMNLVVNARDAMPEGGKLTMESGNVDFDETYTSEHTDVVAGRYVMLAITDTGIGMDADSLARVFEPFFTTKAIGRGTGLGLSTVYGIVKQSGGSISVYSEPGRGTCFKIYLPRVDETPEARQNQSAFVASDRGTETILLVEDDRQVRELAQFILTGCGYSVLEADGPIIGTSLCEQHVGTIHLLLTDVVMPGISGRELAKQIVAQRPDIKVLYMSGYTNNAIVHQGVLDTGTFFLPKPFTPASLAAKVREVLDLSEPIG